MRAFRCIAAPVTLGRDSQQVVATAGALAEALDAELVLVGVAPPAVPVRQANQIDDGNGFVADDQQPFIDLLVRERLDELSGDLPAGLCLRTVMTWGPVGPALIEAARDEHAELIVVAMERGSALSHALHDHDDRHLLHHCPVPVLVVPTSAASRQ